MKMTAEEIRKGAPVGATHYHQYKNGNVIYFKYFPRSCSLYRMTPHWAGTDFTINKLKPLP